MAMKWLAWKIRITVVLLILAHLPQGYLASLLNFSATAEIPEFAIYPAEFATSAAILFAIALFSGLGYWLWRLLKANVVIQVWIVAMMMLSILVIYEATDIRFMVWALALFVNTVADFVLLL